MSDYPIEMHHRAANTIRGLAMDAVQKAESGHPGMPMGMADVAVVLWTQFLKHAPQDPHWPDRDRFVLSAGHGSMLLYSLLHLSGYASMPMEQLQQFRQWGSVTPGHPESHITEGVETTTGPLGQGFSNGAGMALAEQLLAARYNRPGFEVVDHYTYVIVSDGDLMEGISHEVASLVGHLGLGKLVVFYDDNEISIDGSTDLSFTEDVMARFAAYGWHTQSIDGHDPQAILEATRQARAETERPSIIACHTTIGFGSPHKAGTASAHGEPLGEEEIRTTKEKLGLPPDEKFFVADGVRGFMAGASEAYESWKELWEAYAEAHSQAATAFEDAMAGKLPENWDDILPEFEVGKSLASRASSGQVINAIAPHVPYLIGGSADLTGSNKTAIKDTKAVEDDDYSGRYIHYGVREHGMGGMMNGMALHGGLRPYGGTFLIFSDYMRPTIRLAAMMELPIIYVFTHDSIGLGEDGPTHQPVEQLMSLRLIPGMTVIRPADAKETASAWRAALENKDGPTALVLSRQGLPTLAETGSDAVRGGYVLRDADDPQVLLMGTGSEVRLALKAAELLAEQGVRARVISIPSWELFSKQSAEYRDSVLPPSVRARVSIETGVTTGWQRYIGEHGVAIGLNRFGASAPYQTIYEKLAITPEAMAEAALQLLRQ